MKTKLLERIIELARQSSSAEMKKAIAELDEDEKKSAERQKKYLETNGLSCVICGKLFLPLPNDYSNCCSIGCRFSD